ncbi:alpha/beta hydrolase [Amycolatopsis acidicola]|uniref:Alpha/beta hydrolase n=1 Tax=Amycolatopsis acidicola TaxID=2596893 RepID=A0A5N0UQ31_9PSEU|nr:alpha/beta hydrolase [Amycolatopsis acidicola]KAA9150172.1 alpha/beta hydrolase [Amycolatopsis acidicola]
MITTADGLRLESLRQGSGPPVVLAHGITADLDEHGLFVRLADRLDEAGFSVLRFSFRGHGRSDGTPGEMTIAGERLDLAAAVGAAGGPVSIVASSFGAVSTTLSLAELPVSSVVLWQPVLDLRGTFLRPSLPRARALYENKESLRDNGFLDIEGRFELGARLFEEFAELDPPAAFRAAGQPALLIHGDADEHISFDVARDAARRPRTDWHPVAGDGHGFAKYGNEVVDATVRWLTRQPKG